MKIARLSISLILSLMWGCPSSSTLSDGLASDLNESYTVRCECTPNADHCAEDAPAYFRAECFDQVVDAYPDFPLECYARGATDYLDCLHELVSCDAFEALHCGFEAFASCETSEGERDYLDACLEP